MSNVASQVCGQCGKPLGPDSPGGLCPNCLMAMNLATQTELSDASVSQHLSAKNPPPAPEEIGRFFPSFEILECLGRGGMGIVYKARQKSLNRLVALKILAPELEKDSAFAQRFALEAQTLAKLNHPGVVTIYDFGQTDRLFYLVMEYVDGVTLRRLLEQGRIAPREALAIVPQICDALQYAHDHGIVHRDIKPENILLDRQGRVKVADFGLAKLMEGAREPSVGETRPVVPTSLTGAGKIMGTPNYMAPEQIQHPAEVDHRADIYALGVVLYQMLTGELPGAQLQPPSKRVQIDVRLDEVVLQALEKDPDRRYQQASQIKSAVETVSGTSAMRVDEQNRAARTSTSQGAAATPPQRTWVYAFAAGILAVLLVEFAVSAMINEPVSTALMLGLPAGGVAFVILLVAPKQWLGGFLVCVGFVFCLWLAALAGILGPWLLGLVVLLVALAVLVWILKKSDLPPGFLRSFLTVHLLIFGASALATVIMPESFVSTARVEIERKAAQPSMQGTTPRISGFYDPYFIQTEFEVIQSEVVLGKVIQDLDLGSKWGQRYGHNQRLTPQEALVFLKRCLDLRPVRNSNLIEIRVFSEFADEAAAIANQIAEQYQAYEHRSNIANSTADFLTVVQIVDKAQPGLRPVRPNRPMNLTIGALAGLLLGTIVGNVVAGRRARI